MRIMLDYNLRRVRREYKKKKNVWESITWIITSKFSHFLTDSESKVWSRWSTKKKLFSISRNADKLFLNRKPDNTSATIGHEICLANRKAAHISSSDWIDPRSRIPFLAPRITFKTSAIWPKESIDIGDASSRIYLVKTSVLDNQMCNPFKQLKFHGLGLFSSGSLNGQFMWTGPQGEEVAQCTAESRVVSTILAGIWSVGAGRLKKNLTNEPKWFTYEQLQIL